MDHKSQYIREEKEKKKHESTKSIEKPTAIEKAVAKNKRNRP